MWPCSHEAKFCLFCKKLCQQRGISSANEFFFTVQNFLNCHQSSQMPSRRVGNLQFFVRRQSPLFFDSYPSSGHFIRTHDQLKLLQLAFLVKRKNFACLWCEQGPPPKKLVSTKFSNFSQTSNSILCRSANRTQGCILLYDRFVSNPGGEGGTPLFGL